MFASHLHALHNKISKQVNKNDLSYKILADSKPLEEFNQSNYDMVRVSLQTCNIGPYEILSKMGSNAHLLDLPLDWNSCSKFNVKELVGYRGLLIATSDLSLEPILSHPSTFNSILQSLFFPLIILLVDAKYIVF